MDRKNQRWLVCRDKKLCDLSYISVRGGTDSVRKRYGDQMKIGGEEK